MAQNRVFKLSGRFDQSEGCTVRICPAHPAFKDGDWRVEIRPKRGRTIYTVTLSQLIRFGIVLAAKEKLALGKGSRETATLNRFFGDLYQ